MDAAGGASSTRVAPPPLAGWRDPKGPVLGNAHRALHVRTFHLLCLTFWIAVALTRPRA